MAAVLAAGARGLAGRGGAALAGRAHAGAAFTPLCLGAWRDFSSSSGGADARPGNTTEADVKAFLTKPHQLCNVTPGVAAYIGRDLLLQPNHPLQIIKTKIFDHFDEHFVDAQGQPEYRKFDDLSPFVGIEKAFDELLIPKDHVSRSPSDTFYLDEHHCLRPHTSAHQTTLMRAGHRAFLCAADVYRRDEIDQSHFPVFHQMEGVYIFPEARDEVSLERAEEHLKETIEGMVRTIFGNVEMRWVEAYFPFTEPSLELEIWFNDEWLEVLGSGVIHQDIMDNCGLGQHRGWAFGLGLERLAMVLFNIPDIRLFWSQDERFVGQFTDGQITEFKPYSKYPPCLKDISFWLPKGFHPNDFYAVVRDIGGDLIERVDLIDAFEHPKTQRQSHCYRITFRSMDRVLTNAEIDAMQEQIRAQVSSRLHVELR